MASTFWVTVNLITTFTTKELVAVTTVQNSIIDTTYVTVLFIVKQESQR